MKITLLLIGFALLLSSCGTYQYITVSSPDIRQNDRHQFVAENDTLRLIYDFNGCNGPVQLTVYNKLDRPLLADLNRSALVINERAFGFNSGKVELSGSAEAFSQRVRSPWPGRYSYSDVNLSGTLPAGIVFIPSGSYIIESPLAITDHNLNNIPDSLFRPQRFTGVDLSTYKMQTASFTQDSSPLVFRTYITFIEQGADKKEIVRQHTFYVSEVRQSTAGPFIFNFSNDGNQFYVSDMSHGAPPAGTPPVALSATPATTPKPVSSEQ